MKKSESENYVHFRTSNPKIPKFAKILILDPTVVHRFHHHYYHLYFVEPEKSFFVSQYSGWP